MVKKQDMRNAAYEPDYLKQRATLERLLFQDTNFTDETDIAISPDILVHKKSYNAQEDNVFYSGCKYSVGINGSEVYAANCVNDDCDFFKLIQHSNGKNYLVFRRDLYGYSLLEIETLKDFHYYPVCSLGFIANEETFEETFIWTDVLYNPLNNLMVVFGCYWACPWDLALVDFSEPFEPAENQVCITFKKDIGDIEAYSWQKNLLVINSKHSKWNKGCKPKKGQAYNGVYVKENTTIINKTHKFTEAICRKWLEEGNFI